MSSNRIEILKESILFSNRFITDPSCRAYKFKLMSKSLGDFYRATADLFYRDLAAKVIKTPRKWDSLPETWICGDYHPGNIGFFPNEKGEIIIDLNDFDDAYIGPFYLDLIRFGAAMFLIRDEVDFNLGKEETREYISDFVNDYRKTLQSVSQDDRESVIEMTLDQLTGYVQKKGMTLSNDPDAQTRLETWTEEKGDQRRFKRDHEDLDSPGKRKKALLKHFPEYVERLTKEDAKSYDGLKIIDLAARLRSGSGSLGLEKYYALVVGEEAKETLILEFKEQILPPLVRYLYPERVKEYHQRFSSHAARAARANEVMLSNRNPLVSWLEMEDTSFLIRPVAPHEDGYTPGDFKKEKSFRNFTKVAARLLALAHSRSDQDHKLSFINQNFETAALAAFKKWKKFDQQITEISEEYAYRVKEDWKKFRKLRKDGELDLPES